MNLRPLIERELRTAARQVATYYVRMLPALVLLTVGGFIYLDSMRYSSLSRIGAEMFGMLNFLLFALIWLVVPLSTADSISREKRDDTLGLLLLTPLRPFEVVVSKMIGGLIGGTMLILAVVPVIAVPILLGGVTDKDLLRVVLLDLSALTGAVGAGVFTSSFSKRRGRAWIVAFFVALLWASCLYTLHVVYLAYGMVTTAGGFNMLEEARGQLWLVPLFGWAMSCGMPEIWIDTGFGSNAVNVGIAGAVLLTSLLMTGLGCLVAAGRVNRFSEAGQLSARQLKIQQIFTKERVFAQSLKKGRRRLLERNPSAWLVRRRWTTRLAQWGWIFLSVAVLTLVAMESGVDFYMILAACIWLGLFLLATVLLISATSLQHERESGALELLLVTHLSPRQLIAGRVQGIRRTFLPSIFLILSAFIYVGWVAESLSSYPYYRSDLYQVVPYATAVMLMIMLASSIPVIGLCFSLNRKGIISSCLNTLFFSIVLPWLFPLGAFGLGLFMYAGFNNDFGSRFPFATILTVILGGLFALQFGLWQAIKKGKLDDFPTIFPSWFTQLKLGWLLPWLVPLGCFTMFEGYEELIKPLGIIHLDEALWMLIFWQVVAWALLAFFSVRSRKALVEMLEKRAFLTT